MLAILLDDVGHAKYWGRYNFEDGMIYDFDLEVMINVNGEVSKKEKKWIENYMDLDLLRWEWKDLVTVGLG